ncbi:MAG: hypothetical protein JNJ83_24100 [Verrucomicrobiaceae bacterium]|nr:hypothetical protein [Verrucomicrobiaceae bacterium]
MNRRKFSAAIGSLALTKCSKVPPPVATHSLLSAKWQSRWKVPVIPEVGRAEVKENSIRLESGAPMTVVRFDALDELGVNLAHYEVNFEARRIEGNDFFAALTFPIGSKDRCLSFINGGWGGGTTGLSNIDHTPASDNLTASLQRYVLGQWYGFNLMVTPEEILVRMDGRSIIRTAAQGQHFGLRPGDIELCAPFGFASYETVGEVRSVMIKSLS